MLAALGLALAIVLIEGVGGFLSGSLALRADAGHVLTDALGLLLSLGACWLATRPADLRRTFGYYRLEIMAAALNGMLLVAIAISIAVAAWQRMHTHAVLNLSAMGLTAAVGLLGNLGGLLFLWRPGHQNLNLRAALWHTIGDVASSLLVVVTAVLIAWTHWAILDPILSVLIAVVIVAGALRLLAEAVDILLEAVPQHLNLTDIRDHIQQAAGVQAVHDLHLWTISSGLYALSAHLVVGGCDLRTCDDILTRVKQDLSENFGIGHTTLQIESEAYRHVEEVH